ncbi:MAG: SusC/RagA family TonB-linked outer membrane protein [Mediterranea sp.]|jgi:TonB-linked SusC/RagA family outer membrane protein|nr:SusC/RagA family TonB-linked outer membrane protein [Mediterranea sp.]
MNSLFKTTKRKVFLLLTAVFLFTVGIPTATAQQATVKGTVKDASSGEPVIGASIAAKGTDQGVITDIDGNFSILTNTKGTLVVSYIGYTTQEVAVNGRQTLNISLREDVQKLNEVVVIGYGTMDKKELTSAIGHVGEKDFLQSNSHDPAMQIQGKIPGVSINNTQMGDPNNNASIQIRGISSRNAGLGPLIVIDGVPGGNLDSVNPNDIASIDVLKDGAASAIYGTRGSNGVVLVTTKRGTKDGKVHTEYNGTIAINLPERELEVLNADEFRKYRVDTGLSTDYGSNTDWFKEITRVGYTQTHSISVAGGNENSSYRVTTDIRDAKGIDLRSTRLDYGTRIGFDHTTRSGLFKFSGNVTPRVIKANSTDVDAFKQALRANPTMPIKDASDPMGQKYTWFSGDDMFNPVERLKTAKDYHEYLNVDWDFTAKLNLLPLLSKGRLEGHRLSTQVTIGQKLNNDHYYTFKPSWNTEEIAQGSDKDGEASQKLTKERDESLEWTVNYGLEKNGHNFGFLGGYSYQQFMNYGFNANNKDFASDALTWDNLNSGEYAKEEGMNEMGSWRNSSKLIAFFGRVTYDYQKRYLMTASLRYEGSSKFGANHKWGYFPAISAGWRISDEPFLKGVKWINDLKIRADFGMTGNQDFSPYKSLPTYGSYSGIYYKGKWYTGWGPNINPNPNLKWEKGVNWNIGIDFALFGKLSGSFNYYSRKQQDLLGDYDVSTPPYLWGTIYANVGTMRNTGFEFQLTYDAIRTKDFSWTTTLVGATDNNKFLHFSNQIFHGQSYYDLCSMSNPGSPGQLVRIQEGQRVGNFFTYRYAGVDDTGNWLVYNKDNEVIPISNATTSDKAVTGNGLPWVTASWNNVFTYKNFDLTLFFTGAFGFDIYNIHDMYFALQRVNASYNTMMKSYTKNAALTNADNCNIDYFIEKGDYVKLDMCSLGYTLNLPKNKWLDRVRVYATARNLFTITGFSGIDPAQYPVNGLTPSTFNGSNKYYPSTRQFMLGAQISF